MRHMDSNIIFFSGASVIRTYVQEIANCIALVCLLLPVFLTKEATLRISKHSYTMDNK